MTRARSCFHGTMRRLLVLSPHPDDAAFSIGGLIQRGARATTLLTIFGRSDFTADQKQESEMEVTNLRRNEDARYARLCRLEWIWKDYPAAGIRFNSDWSKVFLKPGEDEHVARKCDMDQWSSAIQEAVISCGAIERPTLVLLPAGIGGHRDHVVVRDSVCELHSSVGFSLGFYEDLPYATRKTKSEIRKHMLSLKPSLHELCVPIDGYTEKRQEGISVYASQVDAAMSQALDTAPRRFRPAAERLWVTNRREWEEFLSISSDEGLAHGAHVRA